MQSNPNSLSPSRQGSQNYLLYNYTLPSSAPPSPSNANYLSLSPSINNVGFTSKSLFNTSQLSISSGDGQNDNQNVTEDFTPQQKIVHEKLRHTFPSYKNVPDYFLAYFSIVLSDESTLKETLFSNANDISFYLEIQAKIEDLFLEDEKLGKSPVITLSSASASSSYAKSPFTQQSVDSSVWGTPIMDIDGNISIGYLTNSEDNNDNITCTNNLDSSVLNEKYEISSSIINTHRDFLNPFHMMDRNELPIRLLIVPRILKNIFYAKTEVAQMMSPIFSNRNSLHFRDAFIQSNEFVMFVVVGFWVLEFLPSASIILPKLIYASSELMSTIQNIPVVATLKNNDGRTMDTIISTIVRWNTGKKNQDMSYMAFVDELLDSLSIKFKWKNNPTLVNFRNHNYAIEFHIPNHYNLLKAPSITSILRMKTLDDFTSTIPKLMYDQMDWNLGKEALENCHWRGCTKS